MTKRDQKNKKNRKKSKQVKSISRASLVFVIMFIVLLIYLVRLLYLQVFSGDEERNAALAQRTTSQEIQAPRGTIYDRNRRPLAVSVSVNSIYIYPQQIEDADKDRFSEITGLVLGIDKGKIRNYLDSDRDTIRLKDRLTEEEVKQMNLSGLPGFSIVQEPSRYYPNQDSGAQNLGFLNEDKHGEYGLEREYDKILAGSPGRLSFSHDLSGHVIPTEDPDKVDSQPGMDLVTTLDLDIQKLVTQALKETMEETAPHAIMAVVVDPRNGEILAMDSLPSFNPNKPREEMGPGKLGDQEGNEEQVHHMEERWKNPNVSFLYEPGSVFKTLTAAIALETQSVQPDDQFLCTGSIELAPGQVIHCVDWEHPHGNQTMERALNNSCNPAFVQIAWKIGRKSLYSYLKSLNIGGYSHVDMPGESQSMLADSVEDIGPVELGTMSYGHGVAATPLQVISACNTTINGGHYYPPHLYSYACREDGKPVDPYQKPEANQVFSDDTVKTMRKYLKSTAEYNHAPMVKIPGVSFGGKSGTSVIAKNKKYSKNKIASYWAFYPADAPKYSVLVVCDRARLGNWGGVVGARTVAKIFKGMVQLDKAQGKDGKDMEQARLPNLTGLTAAEARDKLEKLGLQLVQTGTMSDFDIVADQDPKPGSEEVPEKKVRVMPDDLGTYKVPDFMGMTRDQAEGLVDQSSIQVHIEGEGRVVFQSPGPGEKVPGDKSITLHLSRKGKKKSKQDQDKKATTKN